MVSDLISKLSICMNIVSVFVSVMVTGSVGFTFLIDVITR